MTDTNENEHKTNQIETINEMTNPDIVCIAKDEKINESVIGKKYIINENLIYFGKIFSIINNIVIARSENNNPPLTIGNIKLNKKEQSYF
jgi:hypothetical protein